MATDLNTAFVALFAVLFAALGVSNTVEGYKLQQKLYPGQAIFGILFLAASVGIFMYKIKNP